MESGCVKSPFNAIMSFTHRHWKTILLGIIISLATLLLSAIISIWLSRYYNLRLPTLGTIRTIGVEVHGGDLIGGRLIDWGIVYPGTLTNRSFYIRSESNTQVKLSLKQSNFTFLNSKKENVTQHLPSPGTEALNLTWNYSGNVLNPKQEIFVTLTLNVSNDPSFIRFLVNYEVTEFNFDICIEAKPIE
ncbi:MAG: hypothetical protein QXH20_04135 [Candidatus Bathyarchaeia archaeon]